MAPNAPSLTHRTVGGMLWLAAGKAAYAGLQLIVLAILARLVLPTDFGVVTAALVVIGFSAIVSQLGLGPAIVQRPDLEQRHLHTAFTASVVFGLGLGAALWLVAPAAAVFFRTPDVAPVLRALACVFPLQGLGTVADSIARRELRFRWLAMLDVKAYGLGYGVVGVALGLAGQGVWALVVAEIAEALLRTVILLANGPRPRFGFERRALGELLYFGGGFTVAKIAHYFAVQGDRLVVGRMLGPAALGLYGRAYQLMSAPAASLGNVIDNALFPAMARVQHQLPRLATAYRRGITLVAGAVLPLSAVLWLLAPEVVAVVLGSRWDAVVEPFRVLGAAMVLHTSSKISDTLVRATGAVYRRAWRQILFAVLVIGGAVTGQRWGIVGVAYGSLVALSVNYLLMAHLSVQLTGIGWPGFWRAHLPAALLTIATAPLAGGDAALLRGLGVGPLPVIVGAGVITLAWAALLVWRFPHVLLGPDAMWMLETLRGFLPHSLGVRRPPAQLAPETRDLRGA